MIPENICDSNGYLTVPTCTPGINEEMARCIPPRIQGQTCDPSYDNGACGAALECVDPFDFNGLGHCCPTGYTYSGGLCQPAAPPPTTCREQANPDQYCANLNAAKPSCCGEANAGHCEACCSPEATYKDCPLCQYCNTTAGLTKWKCSNQLLGVDIKDDCPINKACSGYGTCDCIDSNTMVPSPCTWPLPTVREDCVECSLEMCNDDCNKCPDKCVSYPIGNPFMPTFMSCCLPTYTPDCYTCCVLEEGGGPVDGCNDYASAAYPTGCCDSHNICTSNHCCPAGHTWDGERCQGSCADLTESCASLSCCSPYSCSNNHCCAEGYFWNVTSSKCVPTCSIPTLPASPIIYACATNHSSSAGTSLGCGVACFHGADTQGTVFSDACRATEQCVRFYFDVPADYQEDKKNCRLCIENLTACCHTGMTARYKEDCEKCGMWLSECHCCPKDYEWSNSFGNCVKHDSCYRASSDSTFCNYRAPDSSYLPQTEWWDTPFNPRCVDTLNMQACCFVDEGLYGWVVGEDFYLWHEKEAITTY